MRVLCLLAASLPAVAARADALDNDLLRRATEHVRAYLEKLPDYVCRVDIERFQQVRPGSRLIPRDQLALEVAFAGGRELYGMPGATRFDEGSIDRFTGGTGALSTGSYAMHIREVFATGRPEFLAAGVTRERGRERVRIAFHIPPGKSVLTVSERGRRGVVGYSGVVYLTPGAFELEELEVRITEVPRWMSLAKSGERTLYHRVRIGDRELALPASTELTLITRSGQEIRNAVTFRNCRRFEADSTIRFEEPDGTKTPAGDKPPPATPPK
jgi:hypothetical protein